MGDIVVHGAGIFGLSAAWACLSRGARVVVVDPYGVGAGASGGYVGALAPHVPENWNDKKALQFESLKMAAGFWADVAQVSGRDPGYARSGRVQPIMDNHQLDLAHARHQTAAKLWQGDFEWRVMAARDDLAPSPTGWMVYDSLTARLHPGQACAALAHAIIAKGGQIVNNLPTLPKGAREIWATGVHDLAALSDWAGKTVGNGVKGQAAVLQCDLRDCPQVFADSLHIVPHGDGTVAIGSTSERDYDAPTTPDGQLDTLIAKARRHCPALAQAPVIGRWAGLRPRARSRAPILGRHPRHAGAFIMNGGFKIGFGMAPICAQMMADLVLDGHDNIPPAFHPKASL
jgi:glycine oxidase